MAGGGDGSGFTGRTDVGVSGLLVIWVDSWRSCEGPTGIREVRGSPVARNRKAEQDTGGGPRAQFRRGRARGRRWKPREASWRQGGAAAGLGRSWGAPE
jgi:hypothetical protein